MPINITEILIPFHERRKMSVAIKGTVTLNTPSPNVVRRIANIVFNSVQPGITKDFMTDPTFECNQGDTYLINLYDEDNVGSKSQTISVGGIAQTPPPDQPKILGISFTLA